MIKHFFVFMVGIALGLAQGSLALAFQVAVTGSLTGYMITMVSWLAGSSFGLWYTSRRNSGLFALAMLLMSMLAGSYGMYTLQAGLPGMLIGAVFTAVAGFFGGRLIALCDLWGIPPDVLMTLENAGFVLAFCAAVVGLMWFGVVAYALLISVSWMIVLALLPVVRGRQNPESGTSLP